MAQGLHQRLLRAAGGVLGDLLFAAVNLRSGEWDPATARFAGDEDFLAFVRRARAQALYDTGIEPGAEDEILTLITCDRSYGGASGRLIVMAVQESY